MEILIMAEWFITSEHKIVFFRVNLLPHNAKRCDLHEIFFCHRNILLVENLPDSLLDQWFMKRVNRRNCSAIAGSSGIVFVFLRVTVHGIRVL